MDLSAHIANERRKAISGNSAQLGSALLAAAVVKIYLDRTFGWDVALWLLVSGALMSVAWRVLGLLESES